MQYNGGKKRIAKKLAAIINAQHPLIYWEPFAGVASVARLVKARRRFCSDNDLAVISVLQAAIDGFSFPENFTEKQYRAARLLPETSPIHGFAKYGCSFAGKPWGGYARRFDSIAFWHWATQQSQQALVLVSEYHAPPSWVEVFSEEITDGLVPRSRRNTEKLFVYANTVID